MKIKKILSLAITLMMVLSVASIPAMAATLPDGAYANVTASATTYTLEQFKTDFDAATYTAVETFENGGLTIKTTAGANTAAATSVKVSGIEGGSMRLILTKTKSSAKYWLNESAANTLSSGTKAAKLTHVSGNVSTLQYNYTHSDSTVNNVLIDSNKVVQTDIKLKTFAIVLHSETASTATIKVTHDDNSIKSENVSLTANTNYFCGIEADEGKYIAKVEITPNSELLLDDLSLIFEKPVAPDSVVIDDIETTVAEPQYNGTKTVQLSATVFDSENAEIEGAAVNWSVAGAGATIDQNGLLTLTRTGAASIAGPVTVTATAALNAGATDSKTITVTPTEAYYASSKMTDFNATAYTRADFLTDLNAADYKYVMNFEEGVSFNNNSRKTIAYLNSKVSTVDSEYKVTINSWADQEHSSKQQKFTYNNTNMSLGMTEDGEFEFELPTNAVADTRRPTAFGMMLGKNANDLDYKLRIYLDNDEEIEYTGVGEKEVLSAACGFFGYKAPGGRYISKIELETGATATLDDLCFIFEDPSAAPITFSTDEAGTNLIGGITGLLTDKIYINVKSGTLNIGEKAILALYDGNELIDVAMVKDGKTQATATIPTGSTLTTVKAFVWNMERLVPVQNDIVLDK